MDIVSLELQLDRVNAKLSELGKMQRVGMVACAGGLALKVGGRQIAYFDHLMDCDKRDAAYSYLSAMLVTMTLMTEGV